MAIKSCLIIRNKRYIVNNKNCKISYLVNILYPDNVPLFIEAILLYLVYNVSLVISKK